MINPRPVHPQEDHHESYAPLTPTIAALFTVTATVLTFALAVLVGCVAKPSPTEPAALSSAVDGIYGIAVVAAAMVGWVFTRLTAGLISPRLAQQVRR